MDKGLTEISSVVILLVPGNSTDISLNLPEYMLGSKLNSMSILIADGVGFFFSHYIYISGFPINGGMTMPNIRSFDPGTYGF